MAFGRYRLARKIKNYFVPSNFQKKIQKQSDELYVFGNGYSIANLDLSIFQGKDCFVCNEFYRMKGFSEFSQLNNISYFTMDGMRSFEKSAKFLNQSLEENLDSFYNPWLTNSFNVVVNPTMKNYIASKVGDSKIVILSDDVQKIFKKTYKEHRWDKKLIKTASSIRHTPHAMIFVSIMMGYKRIWLYGLDHTYVRDILNKSPMAGKHFYLESQKQVLYDNRVTARGQYPFTLSKLFINNALTFQIYEAQKEIADTLGIQIADKTNGSLFCFQDFDIYDLAQMDNQSAIPALA